MTASEILNDINEVKEKKNLYLSFPDFHSLSKREGFVQPHNKTYGFYKEMEVHGEPFIKDGEPFIGTSDEYLAFMHNQRAEYLSTIPYFERLLLNGLFF